MLFGRINKECGKHRNLRKPFRKSCRKTYTEEHKRTLGAMTLGHYRQRTMVRLKRRIRRFGEASPMIR